MVILVSSDNIKLEISKELAELSDVWKRSLSPGFKEYRTQTIQTDIDSSNLEFLISMLEIEDDEEFEKELKFLSVPELFTFRELVEKMMIESIINRIDEVLPENIKNDLPKVYSKILPTRVYSVMRVHYDYSNQDYPDPTFETEVVFWSEKCAIDYVIDKIKYKNIPTSTKNKYYNDYKHQSYITPPSLPRLTKDEENSFFTYILSRVRDDLTSGKKTITKEKIFTQSGIEYYGDIYENLYDGDYEFYIENLDDFYNYLVNTGKDTYFQDKAEIIDFDINSIKYTIQIHEVKTC